MMSYSQFLIEFLDAFVTNITIGVLALAGGMLVGIPLAYLRRASGLGGRLAAGFVALLRASPVFVLMFLFVNVFGSTVTLSGLSDRDLTYASLILALCAYSFSVVSDVVLDALEQRDAGNHQVVKLLIPNLFRIFSILVMATSVGAAIGVREAVFYSLGQMELLPHRAEKIWLMIFVILFFTTFFLVAKHIVLQLVTYIKKADA
jgi:ABC-type amino acid transport system permease subunit